MDGLDEALQEFLAESDENLDQLDRDLVAAEGARPDRPMFDRTFRALHTLKGTCGFFSLTKLDRLAHAGEHLLGALREGKVAWSPEAAAALLRLTGSLRSILRSVASGNDEGDDDHAELIAAMDLLRGDGAAPPSTPTNTPMPIPPVLEPEPVVDGDPSPGPGGPANHVRVDIGLLDALMNLVGELVVARNQILRQDAALVDPTLHGASLRLNHITTELQEGVMKARMQPIGKVWGKLPRVVRDLSVACGKQVRLEFTGQETELDRTILEAIKDPLTHLIRNAVDHGIEPPARRASMGKPEVGTLKLLARHQNGQVVLEVSDDGGGIDPAAVARKAVQGGLITSDQASRMAETDLQQLIFLPGFSTADRVTQVSGRGVGMDVVKTNVEAIGGTLDVLSTPGVGTTIRLKIPLTLAIIPALIIEAGGDRYAIPQANLLEVLQLDAGQAKLAVDWVRETPVYRLRGSFLPLVDLGLLLGVELDHSAANGPQNIVVLQADGNRFGLVVDEVLDCQEIVVKPVGRLLKGLPFNAGAAILGEGRVALILDVAGLASESRIVAQEEDAPSSASLASETRLFLIGKIGEAERFALPLEQVIRLEQVPAGSVEIANGREVIQYRGTILPLVRMPGGDPVTDPEETLRVVVHQGDRGLVGLIVEKILDVIGDDAEILQESEGPGRVGTAVIGGRVTELIDLPLLLKDLAFGASSVAAGETDA